jgi:hypothetical protein
VRDRLIALAAIVGIAAGACSTTPAPTATGPPPGPATPSILPGFGPSPSPPVTPPPTPLPIPVAGGCGMTVVYAGPGPDARLGLEDNPWAPATPADAGIVAYFWYPPPGILSVADPTMPNSGDTKVLWVVHGAVQGPLSIEAHPLAASLPVVAVRLSNGDKGTPSSIAVPTPGCWRLEIALGATHATLDVMVAATSSQPSSTPTATARASASPAPTAVAADCPVTKPVAAPPSIGDQLFGSAVAFGDSELWVGGLGADGVIVADPRFVASDGSISWKLGWWRIVPGTLTISGRRLDAAAPPLGSDVPGGYGRSGFQASGLDFPTEGCWQITGTVGGSTLTFVTLVLRR